MDYKQEKESFVSGGQGSSMLDVVAIWSGLLLTHLLWRSSYQHLAGFNLSLGLTLVIEFAILVLPLLALTTFLADRLWLSNLVLGLCAASSLLFKPSGDGVIIASSVPNHIYRPQRCTHGDGHDDGLQPVPNSAYSESTGIEKLASLRRRGNLTCELQVSELTDRAADSQHHPNRLRLDFRQQFLTVYRSQLMLMTLLCILAVDFNVFPRKFAKTESWGISLMDSGVGSFVFSLGIISALPILRRTPVNKSLWLDIWHGTKKTIPLFALGLIRTLSVKGVDYPEHVTEYGVHWNFFFTLSTLPMAGILARRFYEAYRINLTLIGLFLGLVYQCILSLGGLQSYVLSSAPRTGLIAANREGLASIIGYVVIYLFGISSGCYMLPPSPDFLDKLFNQAPPSKLIKSQPGKALVVFSSWNIIWWTLYAFFTAFVSPPSRRLANPTYCLWIAANNSTAITGNCLVETLFLQKSANQVKDPHAIPQTLELINRNSLAIFLVANLMTGLINLSVHTLHLSDLISVSILVFYSVMIVFFAWLFKGMKFKL